MRPYRVVAEWMEIQPLLSKGKIESVRILNVRHSSPAAMAGVRDGMKILIFHGIDVRGLTEEEFGRRLDALPLNDKLSLVVKGLIGTREIIIPMPRQANPRPSRAGPAESPPPGQ